MREVARAIGLEGFLDRRPGQLSGGQCQRVAMGRAMIREPEVFLFDEPLSNLDVKLRVAMRLEVRHLHERLGVTSIFVTHDQVQAMTLADRLVVMNTGSVEQVGAPAEVYDRPARTYVAGFLGSPPMNLLPAVPEGGSAVLPDGQRVPVPGPPGEVTLGVRPERLSFRAAPGEVTLRASFDFSEELGMGRLFHGTLAGVEGVLHAPEREPPAWGRPLEVHAEPDALHLFDAATGRRLGAPAPSRRSSVAHPAPPRPDRPGTTVAARIARRPLQAGPGGAPS